MGTTMPAPASIDHVSGNAALQVVRFLTMLAFVEPDHFLFSICPDPDYRLDDHKDHECHDTAVYNGDAHGDQLCPELARIAVQKAFGPVYGRIGKNACQDRADSPADAVNAERVERVIIAERGLELDHGVERYDARRNADDDSAGNVHEAGCGRDG